jgi:hypothetical protein
MRGKGEMTTKLALLACVISSSVSVHGAAPMQSPTKVSTTVRGVEFTMSLPGLSFPRGALVRAVVTMKNEGKAQTRFGVPTCRADGPSPTVQVVDSSDRVVFPAALPPPPLTGVPCVLTGTPQLLPGTRASKTFYIVLRASRVRASVRVPGFGLIRTPVLQLHLGAGDAPSFSLSTAGTVNALVTPPAGAPRAPLYYTDWYVCGSGQAAYVGGRTFREQLPKDGGVLYPIYAGLVMGWGRAEGMQMAPGCSRPKEWHVAAALLGHTAVYANYGGR